VNFSPPLPRQLSFEFVRDPELEPLTPWQRAGMGRTAFYARRRTQRAIAAAYELGKRRQKPLTTTKAVSTIPRPFLPTPAEGSELMAIANRLARLAPSHRDPAAYFETKSEIVFALRRIASRARRIA
jgi:hypothetical protein